MKSTAPWRPTARQLQSALKKRVADVIRPNLHVLFCGINPGRYSAAVGHHFARPGNLFWPTLFSAGFTPRLFTAFDEAELLSLGYGITNFVSRATAAAADLSSTEVRTGGGLLLRKVARFRPRFLAIVGLQSFRLAFDRPHAQVGSQPEPIGSTTVWLLPNPSRLNAHYQPKLMTRLFADLHAAVHDRPSRASRP